MPLDPEIFGHPAAETPQMTRDADIFKDIPSPKEATAEQPKPKSILSKLVGDDPLRQIALGSRGVAEGMATIPLMVGDAANRLINYGIQGVNAAMAPAPTLSGLITGQKPAGIPLLPMASDSLSSILTNAGAPVPETPGEKLVYQANKGGAAGVAFPALAASKRAPAAINGLQGASGALSAGVTQALENADYPPLIAAGLGAIAGLGVPSSPDVLMAAGRGGKAAIQPFTQVGREEIVGNALARMATRPKAAVMKIGTTPDEVSQLTTAQASMDPGLLATERALGNLPSSGGRFAVRYAEQNAARRQLLDSMARSSDELAAAKAARSSQAESLYEPAFNIGPIKPTEDLIAISKRPAFEQAAKKAMEIAGNEGLDLGSPLNTMRGLHYLKKGVDDLIENSKPGSNEMRALVKMKNDLLGVIDDISPAYKTAREEFARMSKPINQMETLQEIRMRSLNSGLDVRGNRVLSQAKFTNAVTNNLDELKKTLSPDQVITLKRIAKDLDYGTLSATGGKVAGSNTFQNLSVANVLGSVLGKEAAESPAAQSLLRPLGFLYKLPERQVEELMIDAMLDRNMAIRLMSKATERNIDALAAGLKARVGASTRGSIGGAVSSQQ